VLKEVGKTELNKWTSFCPDILTSIQSNTVVSQLLGNHHQFHGTLLCLGYHGLAEYDRPQVDPLVQSNCKIGITIGTL
jgi:hypothetical protein